MPPVTEGLPASQIEIPPIQSYHPTTFLERGVAVPFTTPLLGGTRARPSENRGLELVVPNPSGGRGVYIMPWTSITVLCRPTLHDKMLNERIVALKSVTPATMRRAAREIAAEGLAGEEAGEAALSSTESDKGNRLLANYLLLVSLIEQVNVAPAAALGPSGSAAPDMEKRAKMTIAWIAPRLGQSTTWVATALEAFAEIMESTGVGSDNIDGRIPRHVRMLRKTSTDIAEWSRTQKKEDQAAYAAMICSVADFTLTLADDLLGRVYDLTNDMVGLLRTWAADQSSIIRLAGRPEWLLDGWEAIGLIWHDAWDDATRRSALVEIAGLIPIQPREVNDWCRSGLSASGALGFRRMVRVNEDWRTGATLFNLIARNERFRATMLLSATEREVETETDPAESVQPMSASGLV